MMGILDLTKRLLPNGTTKDYLQFIRQQINKHIGNWVILKEKEGHNTKAYLIRIIGATIGEYPCWRDDGSCDAFFSKTIDLTSILTDEIQLIFLEKI